MLSVRSEPNGSSAVLSTITLYGYSTYVQVAITTVLCYDTITTFDKEVEYFWSSPRKFTSIVYFFNRYVGILAAIANLTLYSLHTNTELCNFSAWTWHVADWITIVLIDYILVMRVLALFSRARKMVVCLNILFIAEAAVMLGIEINTMIKEKISVGETEGFAFCGTKGKLPSVFDTLYWAVSLLTELILMCLALYKASQFWRTSAGLSGMRLVRVLIQDQAIYFVLVMASGAAHITYFWVDQHGYVAPAVAGIVEYIFASTTFPCIIGCRMLVHLDEALEKGVNEGTSYRLGSTGGVSEIQFA